MTHVFNRKYFEQGIISNYHGYTDFLHFKLIAKEIFALFTPNKVLEIGCAKGYIVKHLRELGIEAFGIDISDYAIKKADKCIKPFVRVAKAQNIPFENDMFDLVFSIDVFEHIPENEVGQVIAEVIRVGKNQYHLITTKELTPKKDITHVTLRPIWWWREQFSRVCEETSDPIMRCFIVESEKHWIHDLIKYSMKNKKTETQLKKLRLEKKKLHNSRGWKIISLIHELRIQFPLLRNM